ncbi:MAG TPA: glycoside hydrolase family 32 protein [Pirellulales bacterium]|nr:glycoside hydrolase family 32 protein [Pirellulales bacterium]
MKKTFYRQAAIAVLGLMLPATAANSAGADEASEDVIFADFEGDDYGDWQTSGAAFGKGPAQGTLPGQMPVSGFFGHGLVNSFWGGDGPTGKLASPEFKIERKFLGFLIGGGGHPRQTCMNLLIDGKVVRSTTGSNTQAGGSEQLEPAAWDVSDLVGKTARLEIVDEATGGWGHVNVDQIVFTDRRPVETVHNAKHELMAAKRFLLLPVRNGGIKRRVTVSVAERAERQFEIELADGAADWWAPLDVGRWQNQSLAIEVDKLPADSQAFANLRQSNDAVDPNTTYHEALRPQLHFSPRRGWMNDPNGLVFYQGRYHAFFQHNPYGTNWGNMHWGHAVSRDLLHWEEVGEALYPDAMGTMFSGSAVVDWRNTSGLGRDAKPPLALFYTAAGDPTVQCLAYSNDGGQTFIKYDQNPIVQQISPGNRDPKVIWHEPSRHWVMVLYVGLPDNKHAIDFLTSTDLKTWKTTSRSEGFFECPDLFELPVDGDKQRKRWVLTAASSEYQVGSFDGERFTPETPKLAGHRGRGFYAAQTFSDIPAQDGRRIQFGWLQAPSPGMSFNQSLSLPLELRLKATADGPRLAWSPVKEFESLRGEHRRLDEQALATDATQKLDKVQAELLDIVSVIEPGENGEIRFDVRGVPISYHADKHELDINGHRVPASLNEGKLDLRVVVDRTSFEVFASGGLIYVPIPVIPAADNRNVSVTAVGAPGKLLQFDVYELRSIWP